MPQANGTCRRIPDLGLAVGDLWLGYLHGQDSGPTIDVVVGLGITDRGIDRSLSGATDGDPLVGRRACEPLGQQLPCWNEARYLRNEGCLFSRA